MIFYASAVVRVAGELRLVTAAILGARDVGDAEAYALGMWSQRGPILSLVTRSAAEVAA